MDFCILKQITSGDKIRTLYPERRKVDGEGRGGRTVGEAKEAPGVAVGEADGVEARRARRVPDLHVLVGGPDPRPGGPGPPGPQDRIVGPLTTGRARSPRRSSGDRSPVPGGRKPTPTRAVRNGRAGGPSNPRWCVRSIGRVGKGDSTKTRVDPLTH